MHVDTQGQGTDLVLLHGWAMHGGIFAPIVARLAAHYRVHVVDLPGHGYSRNNETRFVLQDIVDRLKHRFERPVYVGWSLGALAAMQLAVTHPESIHALGVIAASPRFVRGPSGTHGVDVSLFQQFRDDLAGNYRRTIERFLALEVMDDDKARVCLRELKAHVFDRGEPDAHVLEDGLDVLAQTDLTDRMSHITCPSLWIAGGRDRLVSFEAMAHAAETCRGRYYRLDHAGHAPFISQPDDVVRLIDILMREAGNA